MDASPTDTELISRTKASDQEAFRLLFERYQPVLFRQILFMTGEADAAHDIVQESFLRIWESRSRLKPELSILAYAVRIGGNLARDLARRRRRHERLEGRVPPPARTENHDPEEVLHRSLLEARLSAVVNERLPERCRTVFLLSRFENLNNREIAVLLGISVRTVEHQMNRALRILRRNLRPFVEPRRDS
jgi:RNA polymerase sigma-70 factor (ECF subfamily)